MPSLKKKKPTNYNFAILKARAKSKIKSLKKKKGKKRVPKYEKLQEVEELQPIPKLKNIEDKFSISQLVKKYV